MTRLDGGRTLYGLALGVIMLETGFPGSQATSGTPRPGRSRFATGSSPAPCRIGWRSPHPTRGAVGDRHVGQQSVLKAALADIVPSQMRAYGFGMFATVFGVFWFVGSATIGLLYDLNVTYLVIFSVAIQLIALPLFIWPWRHREPATA